MSELNIEQLLLEALQGKKEHAEECSVCSGGGWICYGIGIGDPHFKECDKCGNPENLECP